MTTAKTELTFPPGWGAIMAAVAGGAAFARDGVTVQIHPLRVRPRDPRSIVPAEVAGAPITRRRTAGGWMFELVVLESRLVAVYDFHGDLGVVIIDGPAPALLARKDELMAILESGAPDWRGPIVALAQLWA